MLWPGQGTVTLDWGCSPWRGWLRRNWAYWPRWGLWYVSLDLLTQQGRFNLWFRSYSLDLWPRTSKYTWRASRSVGSTDRSRWQSGIRRIHAHCATLRNVYSDRWVEHNSESSLLADISGFPIGLSIRVRLLRSLPHRFKIDIRVKPGSHQTEREGKDSDVDPILWSHV